MRRSLQIAIISIIIGGWFLGSAWRGLTVYFNTDDMTNLYRAWDCPLRDLMAANLTPFTRLYRPAGAVFYRVLYALFGLHPLPFRIAVYALLLMNIALLYWLAKLISESTEVAVVAAVLGAYHNRLMDIYIFGGMIYDVLCFTFFVLAMCVYIRARSRDAAVSWGWFAAFLALNVAALNSKEMAATLPVILLGYEWLYHRPFSFRKSAPVWVSLAITIATTMVRMGAGTAFSGNAAYTMHVSVRQFFLTSRQFLDNLFLLHAGTVSTAKAVLIFAAVWAIAIFPGRRELRFAAWFITITPLPVNFIAARGFFAMYLPLAGWAIFFAILIVKARDRLLSNVWHRPPIPGGWQPERVALFMFVLWAMFDVNSRDRMRTFADADNLTAGIRALGESLGRIHASVPKGGSVLVMSDAIEDGLQPVYVVRLFYGDPTIEVDRETGERRVYDLMLAPCDQGYCEVKR